MFYFQTRAPVGVGGKRSSNPRHKFATESIRGMRARRARYSSANHFQTFAQEVFTVRATMPSNLSEGERDTYRVRARARASEFSPNSTSAFLNTEVKSSSEVERDLYPLSIFAKNAFGRSLARSSARSDGRPGQML